LVIQNIGTQEVSTLNVSYSVNGGNEELVAFSSLTLARGEEALLQMPDILLTEGNNEISFSLIGPNGQADQSPANNSRTFTVIVNSNEDRIPLRENFEMDFAGSWVAANPTGGGTWQSTATNFGNSAFVSTFTNTTIGDEAWLVSPVLDFSGLTSASMVFDISQRQRLGQDDQVRIMVSMDCGDTFSSLVTLDLNSAELGTLWKPSSVSDWVSDYVVGLSSVAGESNVRIAFVVTNANGNNVYLDNIEFFTTSQPALITIADEFTVYGYNLENPGQTNLQITFNLETRQDVELMITDMAGKILAKGMLRDVLNQTFPLRAEEKELQQGVYIVRLAYGGKIRTHRILLPG
jgi:hypothetical protein